MKFSTQEFLSLSGMGHDTLTAWIEEEWLIPGGDRLIGEKLNERKPQETHEWQRRPGPIEDAKPDSGCADIGRQLASDGCGKPGRIGAAELRHENFEGAKMHDEGDEAGEYDRPKKPCGHQVRPIAGPGSGLRKVRGNGFGRS